MLPRLKNLNLFPSRLIYISNERVCSHHKQILRQTRTVSSEYKKIENVYQRESQSKTEEKYHFSFLPNLIFAGLGIIAGISGFKIIKNKYLENEKSIFWRHRVLQLLPSVRAASFFSDLKDSTLEKSGSSEPKLTNRKNHNFIADVVEKVSDGVVLIEIQDDRRTDYSGKKLNISNGSGFVVDSNGLIITNAHVVTNKPRASSIMVRLSNGKEYKGVVEELDAISDLALVRIKTSGLKPLNLGSSKDIRPGEFVVALGCPLSLTNTITSGVVSSVGRASRDLGLRGRDIDYIQTDAAITFGNSGGPLVNLDGEVIGINSMKVTSGISFAIPIDYAKNFLDKAAKRREFLAKNKKVGSEEETSVKRRYLGITMLTLTPEIIFQMQQRGPGYPAQQIPADLTHGILIWRIVVGSPAYNAGLEPGDIVTNINGKDILSSRDVYKLLETKTDLTMVVVRKGQSYTVTIAPED
ncbi:UNVERIFIED_CONTAM: hypothetical protein RMT77_013449 [Armadillidium vulgare]